MTSKKSQEKKDFIISERKKIRPGLSGAPVWAMQKSGKRIWSSKAKRNWKNVDMGEALRKKNLAKQRAGEKNRGKMKKRKKGD